MMKLHKKNRKINCTERSFFSPSQCNTLQYLYPFFCHYISGFIVVICVFRKHSPKHKLLSLSVMINDDEIKRYLIPNLRWTINCLTCAAVVRLCVVPVFKAHILCSLVSQRGRSLTLRLFHAADSAIPHRRKLKSATVYFFIRGKTFTDSIEPAAHDSKR